MRITYGELVATQDKIDKINRRAEKRGFTGRLAVETERVVVQTLDEATGLNVEEVFWDTKITGEPPCVNGWAFVATLDWDEEAGLIVRTAPGVEQVDRDGLKPGWCDHCKKTRVRNKSYLVRSTVKSDNGVQCQVGSTCIKDFLGWSGNLVFFSSDEVQDEVDHLLMGGGYLERRWPVRTVLAVAWAASKAFGYVPASSFDGTPTKSVVLTVLNPNARSKADRDLCEKLRPYVDDAAAQAKLVHEWLLSDEFSGDSEYVRNLKAVAGADSVNARNVGLLASAPQAWARAMERDLVRRRQRAELVNEHFGEPKAKLELTVRIMSIRYIPGDFGTRTLYTMVCTEGPAAGRVFKWFSTNDALGETADTVHKIRGTVKEHDTYNDMKSTVLTRCKKLS